MKCQQATLYHKTMHSGLGQVLKHFLADDLSELNELRDVWGLVSCDVVML